MHPTVGTLFEDSRTPLQLWFLAIYKFTTSRHGVSAKELQRELGVTYKTAWRMGHEIRKHMEQVDGELPLSGEVEIDETYVGGKARGMGCGRGTKNKAVVFGMLQRGGQVNMRRTIHALCESEDVSTSGRQAFKMFQPRAGKTS